MFARISQAQADQLSDDFDVLEGTMNLVQAMYLNNAKEPLTMYGFARHFAMR